MMSELSLISPLLGCEFSVCMVSVLLIKKALRNAKRSKGAIIPKKLDYQLIFKRVFLVSVMFFSSGYISGIWEVDV